MMPSYPITNEVRQAMQRFRAVTKASEIPASGRSELEIVRLLGNTHFLHIERLLVFLDSRFPSSGAIGERLVQQTDSFQFGNALAEFFLLAHLQDCPGAQASPASAPLHLGRYHDINLVTGRLTSRIEVYCPVDFFGVQLVKRLVPPIFKYLDVDIGFEVDVSLKSSIEDGSYVYAIPDEEIVRTWLQRLDQEAKRWLRSSRRANYRQFEGPTEELSLAVTLQEVYERAEDRCIHFSGPTESTDSRLFFETGQPEDTAASQWGRKLLGKLKRRQCGQPSPDYLRMFVVDFSRADTGWPDFICWPSITKRLSKTIKLLAEKAGKPLAYDAVLPVRLSDVGEECYFGEVILLDHRRAEEVERLVQAASFNRPCIDALIDQEGHIDSLMWEDC
ncbi:MAG: hypothetical protein OXN26_07260 [Gammaproteobacteria bacterium]|nr:hypothetical protein [Gammaproteobacteria bacterium]